MPVAMPFLVPATALALISRCWTWAIKPAVWHTSPLPWLMASNLVPTSSGLISTQVRAPFQVNISQLVNSFSNGIKIGYPPLLHNHGSVRIRPCITLFLYTQAAGNLVERRDNRNTSASHGCIIILPLSAADTTVLSHFSTRLKSQEMRK